MSAVSKNTCELNSSNTTCEFSFLDPWDTKFLSGQTSLIFAPQRVFEVGASIVWGWMFFALISNSEN